ncbi:hypothetical protein GCM10010343_31040 [Streptomyces avidinii]|nr:hypothetical protein GCM10010343_31040 [Streptomyces avidinii]
MDVTSAFVTEPTAEVAGLRLGPVFRGIGPAAQESEAANAVVGPNKRSGVGWSTLLWERDGAGQEQLRDVPA